MKSRSFASAALVALAAAVAAGVAHAQQPAKVYRVGALFNRGPNLDDIEQLKKGLARLGYVDLFIMFREL